MRLKIIYLREKGVKIFQIFIQIGPSSTDFFDSIHSMIVLDPIIICWSFGLKLSFPNRIGICPFHLRNWNFSEIKKKLNSVLKILHLISSEWNGHQPIRDRVWRILKLASDLKLTWDMILWRLTLDTIAEYIIYNYYIIILVQSVTC